jgi:hypothetical protein
MLSEMKVDLLGDPLRAKYVPDKGTLLRCFDLGKAIAARLNSAV